MAGGLLFDVELDAVREEAPSYRKEISEHTVEDGAAVADHARPLPRMMTIAATITGEDWEARYERLVELAGSGERGTYVGTNVWDDVMIEAFDPTHTVQISNGVRFNITIKQVRVARVETRVFTIPDPVTGSEVEAEPRERGRQQPGVAEVDPETAPSWLISGLRGIGLFQNDDDDGGGAS